MKIHIVTIGKPKLDYAKIGWEEYLSRLNRLHNIRISQIPDRYQNNVAKIKDVLAGTFVVALDIEGEECSSKNLALLLKKWETAGREISLIIGGPDGLPEEVIAKADFRLSLSKLTFAHDLAMVITLEALYRASAINANLPYHR